MPYQEGEARCRKKIESDAKKWVERMSQLSAWEEECHKQRIDVMKRVTQDVHEHFFRRIERECQRRRDFLQQIDQLLKPSGFNIEIFLVICTAEAESQFSIARRNASNFLMLIEEAKKLECFEFLTWLQRYNRTCAEVIFLF